MPIPDLILKDSKLVLDSHENVAKLEQDLWIKMPPGYLEFLTRYGEGDIDCFLRIYPSWKIAKELLEWRQRINKYWFWDAGKKVLPKARALECIVIADTMNGDEILIHPTRPNSFFVLPRDKGSIYQVDGDLQDLISWIFISKKLINEKTNWEFNPFDSRKIKKEKTDGVVDPEGETFGEIVAVAKKWISRHKKKYLKSVNDHLSHSLPIEFKEGDFKFDVDEYSIVVIPAKYGTEILRVSVNVVEVASKLEIGRIQVDVDDDHSSYNFHKSDFGWKKVSKKYALKPNASY